MVRIAYFSLGGRGFADPWIQRVYRALRRADPAGHVVAGNDRRFTSDRSQITSERRHVTDRCFGLADGGGRIADGCGRLPNGYGGVGNG